jgi:hypothetical protein
MSKQIKEKKVKESKANNAWKWLMKLKSAQEHLVFLMHIALLVMFLSPK